jgi:hypothetical protein
MDINGACHRAEQIFDEERVTPTVRYEVSMDRKDVTPSQTLAQSFALIDGRWQQPRDVSDDPKGFVFRGTNYDLLIALLSQIPEQERPSFIRCVVLRLSWGVGASTSKHAHFPKWNSLVSELPLAAEFLVRNEGKNELFAFLENKSVKHIPGHILLLMQIEEMIALNFTLFDPLQYQRLAAALQKIGHKANKTAEDQRKRNVRERTWLGVGTINLVSMYREIARLCFAISEQCRKARYLYLKGELEEGLNIEVNQDKTAVESYIQKFGFTPSLIQALNEADSLYQLRASPFDLKSSLGHLRSFLENMQKEAMPKIHAKYGGQLPPNWGSGLSYLVQSSILSKAEEQFAVALYKLISDEGVHPLIAEREYVRLARNMVIEYSLLFLTKLDKAGLK